MKKNNSVSLKTTKEYKKKNKNMYENTYGTKTDLFTVNYENGKPEVFDKSIIRFMNSCRLDLTTENEW